MASGFRSIHPEQEKVLRTVGVEDWMVTQGWGNAAASAGTHRKTGTWQGRAFGRCVDLSIAWTWTKEHFDHMIAGGFFPFLRVPPQWKGLKHIHCVYLPPLDGEHLPWPGWVRVQIDDLLQDLNGLASHLPLDQYKADPEQKRMLREVLGGEERLLKVTVRPQNPIKCWAYLQENSVRCEFRPLAQALGGEVLWEPGRPLGLRRLSDGAETTVPEEWEPAHEGDYTRIRLRPVAEWLGWQVSYDAQTRTVNLERRIVR